jgi:hypothetical protein
MGFARGSRREISSSSSSSGAEHLGRFARTAIDAVYAGVSAEIRPGIRRGHPHCLRQCVRDARGSICLSFAEFDPSCSVGGHDERDDLRGGIFRKLLKPTISEFMSALYRDRVNYRGV